MFSSTAAVCSSGTDEQAIIGVLAYRSNHQRQRIKQSFKSMYGKVRNHVITQNTHKVVISGVLQTLFLTLELVINVIRMYQQLLL